MSHGTHEDGSFTAPHGRAIAIVGIGCRLPGGIRDPEGFWSMLQQGVTISVSPRSGVRRSLGCSVPRYGGLLEDVEQFDNEFFGLSVREASAVDPQQRLLLETCWEALEDAGVVPSKLAGSNTCVFLGMHANEYAELIARSGAAVDPHLATGGSRSGAAGRISFLLGLHGPSLVIDSDRSSSLVAAHLACQSIRSGEASIALVGGSNLLLTSELTEIFERAGMLAADGRCKFGDSNADGFVRSEAVAVVVLKALASAERDGDRIYATIRGSAVMNAGQGSGNFMTPSTDSQERLLRAAYQDAGVAPGQVSYVEAHGTGTPIGDQVEIRALGAVLADGRAPGSTCALGSVKTNIGHAEAAAGVVGLIKTALALHHRAIPPSLHCKNLTPNVPFATLSVRIRTELTEWPKEQPRAYAGVSSLGLTGTNAHLVLEEAPPRSPRSARALDGSQLLVLSAKVEASLDALARATQARLVAPTEPLESICATASRARAHFSRRLAVVGTTHKEVACELGLLLSRDPAGAAFRGPTLPLAERPKVVFVFSGTGSQWLGMGQQLLATEPVFRSIMERCDAVVRRVNGWSLLERLNGPEAERYARDIGVVQPALASVSLGLAALWQRWEVQPDAVVGASVGEFAAAYVAGILSLEDAIEAVCRRSELMRRVGGLGAMALVELSASDAAREIAGYEDRLSIGASNGPLATVLSGEPGALKAVTDRLCARGVPCHMVQVDLAAHSPLMEPVLTDYRKQLGWLKPKPHTLPLVSTLTGDWLAGTELSPGYWVRQMRDPVLFYPAIRRLLDDGYSLFLEVSPHPILWSSMVDTIQEHRAPALALRSLVRGQEERRALLSSLGALYVEGLDIDWSEVHGASARSAALPRYQWQRRRCWFSPPPQEFAGDEPPSSPTMTPQHFNDRSHMYSWDQDNANLVQELQRQLSRVLNADSADAIDVKRPLREMGLTSLMMTEFRQALEQRFGISVPATTLFNHPTLAQLAVFFRQQYELTSAASETAQATPVLAPSEPVEAVAPVNTSFATRPYTGRPKAAENVDPIAIVGMACRYPGCSDPSSYWDLLRAGVDAIREVPADRWDADAYYDANPDVPGKMSTRWGGFLDDASRFDAAFFGISPREAESMDPQQRLLLELTWEALENASIDPTTLHGTRGGVFVGLQSFAEYARLKTVDATRIGPHDPAGDSISIATGRIAYTLGLQGPAVSIDTACSSSLVALHYACQSLRSGESTLALVGGVNVMASPEVTLGLTKAKMLSPRGRCRTFDASADGYVRGEGCGMLVLKRLSDALASGDKVWGLVRATAVNQDGRSSGLTAPNGLAQEALIRDALQSCGLQASDVTYIETHGTGTPLGDPIEYQAVASVLGEGRSPERPLLMGSVKTNIGHLESAAGMAGLMKVVLALQHGEIPEHLHLRELNPHIDASLPARVPTERMAWPKDAPRIAAVNSFGFSGTNAHAIIEAAPKEEATPPRVVERRPLHLLTLSAKSKETLRDMAARYADYLEAPSASPLADIAFSTQTARAHLNHRMAVVAADARQAAQKLRNAVATGKESGVEVGEAPAGAAPKLAFLFTGQGSHYPRMGKQLFETEPVFRRAIQCCADILFEYIDRPLQSILFESDEEVLRDQNYTQVALFALEYALYEMWCSWGIEPSFVMGHSLGEYTAACAAGVISVEDALGIVALRGPLAAALPEKGQAAAVWAPPERVAPVVAKYASELAIAAYNAPERLLVSGSSHALEAALRELQAQDIQTKILKGMVAVHSPLMDPMLDPFEAHIRTVKLSRPRVPFVSSVTGKLVQNDELCDPLYWRRHVRDSVRFSDAMLTLHELGARAFLEVGPHHTLVRLGEECLPTGAATWQTSLSKERSPWEQVLDSLGKLYLQGIRIDFGTFHRTAPRRTVQLPNYPWQGGRYWVSATTPRRRLGAQRGNQHPIVGERLNSPLRDIQFEANLDVATLPFLKDHKLWQTVVVPGAFHLERAIATIKKVLKAERVVLDDVVFPEAVVLGQENDTRLSHLILSPGGDDRYTLRILSTASGADSHAWSEHLTCKIAARGNGVDQEESADASVPERLLASPEAQPEPTYSGEELYKRMRSWNYGLGPAFQWMRGMFGGDGETWFRLQMPDAASAQDALVFHPALIDSLFQMLTHVPSSNGNPPSSDALYVPVKLNRFACVRAPQPGQPLLCQVRLHPSEPNERRADIRLFEGASLCAELSGAHIKLAPREALLRARTQNLGECLYEVAWDARPLAYDDEGDAALRLRGAGSWLVLCDAPLGAALAEQLALEGEDPFLVQTGPELRLDNRQLSIRPGHAADLSRVFEYVLQEGAPALRGVIDARSLPPQGADASSASPTLEHLLSLSSSTAQIAQQLSAPSGAQLPRLWVVTQGAQKLPGGPEMTLAGALQAPLWGLGRTIANEMPLVWGGLVDLDPSDGSADAADVFEHIFRHDGEYEVAFRGGRRFTARLRQASLDKRRTGGQPSRWDGVDFRLRGDATYLITGGLGGLGLELARALSDYGARHLALLGRNPEHGRSAESIAQLRKAGVQILVLQADVSRLDQLTRALQHLDENCAPLAGVVHAAGTLDDALISGQNRDRLANVFGPKILGALHLHDLLRERSLDFFLHFSSVAALVGNHGQGNYAAANAFLDAFAVVQRQAGVPAVSVNWGPWGEVGMAAKLESEFYDRWGFFPIRPRQGALFALQLLRHTSGSIGVIPCDWDKFTRNWIGTRVPSPFLEVVRAAQRQEDEAHESDLLERLASTPQEERRAALLDAVQTIVADILGLESGASLTPDRRLEEFGVDSLLSMALVRALGTNLQLTLPKNAVNLHPTLDRLVDYLLPELNWSRSSEVASAAQ